MKAISSQVFTRWKIRNDLAQDLEELQISLVPSSYVITVYSFHIDHNEYREEP